MKTYKDFIDSDSPWKHYHRHKNHNGIRQVGKWACGMGGINCPCCSPLKPNKLKVVFRRYWRRKDKQNLMKEI